MLHYKEFLIEMDLHEKVTLRELLSEGTTWVAVGRETLSEACENSQTGREYNWDLNGVCQARCEWLDKPGKNLLV